MRVKELFLFCLPVLVLADPAVQQERASCPPNKTFSSGRVCRPTCGSDRPGGDYTNKFTGTFQKCVDLCGKDRKCVTAQYHRSNGYCYLKNHRNKAVLSPGTDSADCGPAQVATTSPGTKSTRIPPSTSSMAASTTTTAATATSSSSPDPLPTTCDNAQIDYCEDAQNFFNNLCECALKVDHSTATCYIEFGCTMCSSDADCVSDQFGPGSCAYNRDAAQNCSPGVTTTCVWPGNVNCNKDPPIRTNKRSLEKVFEDASRRRKRIA